MSPIRQSFSFWSFADRGVGNAELLKAASEAGYTAVELIPPDLWGLAREHGLAIAAINGHRSIEVGLNHRENHPAIHHEILANLKEAQKWGIPNLICFAGNRGPYGEAEAAKVTAEGLQSVAHYAEDAGINLVLELLNSKVDHPGYQADHTAWGARVVSMVGSPRVKLLYDAYHMQVMEGDLIRTIGEHHALIAHYHTAGNPGRHDLDEAQEVHWPAVFRAIAATGYDGFIAHEFIPKGDPAAALRAAYRTCQDALNGA
jgi:hydroxypyruvate isomerase